MAASFLGYRIRVLKLHIKKLHVKYEGKDIFWQCYDVIVNTVKMIAV